VDEFGPSLRRDARVTELSRKDAATDKALESVRQLIREIELKKITSLFIQGAKLPFQIIGPNPGALPAQMANKIKIEVDV
jgi:hypothetical protein